MAPNPVLAEVTRGGIAESAHRGAYAIVDSAGTVVESAGEIERPVFPRSAIKAFQALPLVESGAADAAGFTEEELALACASHGGEPRHVSAASSMLSRIGLGESDLECGGHWPSHFASSLDLARAGGEPGALHNNCSGKHSGMLALARQIGAPAAGYVEREHMVQKTVASVIDDLCGEVTATAPCGTDGCSVPTWAIPVKNLARGFARFATGDGMGEQRAAACRRIEKAVFAHPFMVAGSGRYCTQFMEAFPGAAFVKTGAEGVFCGLVPSSGLGITVKCDDGASRAAEVIMSAVLRRAGAITDADTEKAPELFVPVLRNRRDIAVGVIRPAGPLA